ALFAAYRDALLVLAREGEDPEHALRIFEKRLLDALGYGLMLEHDAERGAPIDPDAVYNYVLDRGPCRGNTAGLPAVRVSGATLVALAAERLENEIVMREAKHLMRFVLAPHLGGRPLASR